MRRIRDSRLCRRAEGSFISSEVVDCVGALAYARRTPRVGGTGITLDRSDQSGLPAIRTALASTSQEETPMSDAVCPTSVTPSPLILLGLFVVIYDTRGRKDQTSHRIGPETQRPTPATIGNR